MEMVLAFCLLAAQWGGDGHYSHPNTMTISEDGRQIVFDLSALPDGAKVRRARLVCFRQDPPADSEEALVDAQIFVAGSNKPLELTGPWYDAFAVPPPAVKGGQKLTLEVKALPGWIREKTYLDVAWEHKGKAPADLPAVKGAAAFHRAGQTFITWQEIEKVVANDRPTWGEMEQALDQLDAKRRVRYRVYRSDSPITPASLPQATLLAEVKPLSCHNVNGRSPDQAFVIMRKRMLEDLDYAKDVSRRHYGIPPSAYNEVVIDRLVIPSGQEPLPNGTGLYVHHPARAGKAYYAVTVVVNGRESTWPVGAGQAAGPVEEVIGPGKPVVQREMDMKVLFDYAGRRVQYVHWCAPPLSNLPNQHYNWSVFVPDGVKLPAPLELVLSGNDMFRRPRWPHRLDTILVSPHDAPFGTMYFGYPESHGTLRGLSQGIIQPYTWRRMLAFIDWAVKDLKVNRSQTAPTVDPSRIACSGDRGLSATAALQFGMHHPEVFSLVYSCKGMPNPAAIPAQAKLAGWHPRKSNTEVWHLQRLFGQKEWGLKLSTADGPVNVWEFMNLGKAVAAAPEVPRPMLSYGGRGGWDWPPIAEFLKALADARQPVISEGTWGAVNPPGLKNPGRGASGLDVRLDRPIPVFAAHSGDYQGGRNGDGGQTNYGVWWDDNSIVDKPDRFEIVLTGGGTVNVTPRRMKSFIIKPGEKLRFEAVLLTWRSGPKPEGASGEVTADKLGLATVQKLPVYGQTKLILTRSAS